MAHSTPLIPERGTILEPLTLVNCTGEPIELDPARTLLVLYRGFWCEHCRGQMLELANLAPTFHQAGYRIAAVSTDGAVLAKAMCSLVSGQISIYRDPDATLIAAFGFADRDDAVDHVISRPAVFIVGDDRTVMFRYISRSADDRPTADLLLLGVESLS